MSGWVWFALGLSVAWVIAGVVVAFVVGRTVKSRDEQVPVDDEDEEPSGLQVLDDMLSESIARHPVSQPRRDGA